MIMFLTGVVVGLVLCYVVHGRELQHDNDALHRMLDRYGPHAWPTIVGVGKNGQG